MFVPGARTAAKDSLAHLRLQARITRIRKKKTARDWPLATPQLLLPLQLLLLLLSSHVLLSARYKDAFRRSLGIWRFLEKCNIIALIMRCRHYNRSFQENRRKTPFELWVAAESLTRNRDPRANTACAVTCLINVYEMFSFVFHFYHTHIIYICGGRVTIFIVIWLERNTFTQIEQ